MEIVWDRNINKVPFEMVDIGHTFIYNENIYMRTVNICNNADIIVNAVNIKNGFVATFCDDECVIPIEGKFIIN